MSDARDPELDDVRIDDVRVGEGGGPVLLAGGIEDEMLLERASATPRGGHVDHGDHAATTLAQASTYGDLSLSLSSTQSWLTDVLTGPAGFDEGLQRAASWLGHDAAVVEQVVTAGPRLTSTQRLRIYHQAYRARLVECLVDDYPVVQHLLGAFVFEAVALAYIEAHPSTHPNLNGFGHGFADFVRTQQTLLTTSSAQNSSTTTAGAADAEVVYDLCRLEWALVTVLHAEAPPAFNADVLSTLPTEQQSLARFEASPILRLLSFAHAVNPYLQAVRTDRQPAPIAHVRSWTAVYRHQWKMWRMDFTPSMAAVLQGLLDGENLGTALGRLDADADPALEGNVAAWFNAWVTCGFFSRVLLPDAASDVDVTAP